MKKKSLVGIKGIGTKMEVIESKRFIKNIGRGEREAGDPPYAGKSHYVDENKWCKNVSFGPCHYVNENTST
jgi:hypothetical protein